MNGNANTIPNFLKAKSAKRLRVLVAANNVRLNMAYVAYQFLHDGKDFYAFYNEPIAKVLETEMKDGNTEGN